MKAALTQGQISDTLRKRRCAWESLLGVDESVMWGEYFFVETLARVVQAR